MLLTTSGVTFFISPAATSGDQLGIISLSLGLHFLNSGELPKHFSITSRAIETQVEAPGDAPRRPQMVPLAPVTTSVPNWSMPLPVLGSFLMICARTSASKLLQANSACWDEDPVIRVGLRVVVPDVLKLSHGTLENVLHEHDGQAEVSRQCSSSWKKVVWLQCLEGICDRSIPQELHCHGTKWSKQQHLLATDGAVVQVRHGHRWCSRSSRSIHLDFVLTDNLWVLANGPVARHRQSHVAVHFWNSSLLEHQQCPASRTDENELGLVVGPA